MEGRVRIEEARARLPRRSDVFFVLASSLARARSGNNPDSKSMGEPSPATIQRLRFPRLGMQRCLFQALPSHALVGGTTMAAHWLSRVQCNTERRTCSGAYSAHSPNV
ncbi:hypothetical protein CALVIDRAFT_215043 [Calocera viscosa TUFC12733]|uniref:Uncharacterized protein n=1 Tax=Calocera viscosa (strain TUFC12733) TaxID=1330018 RepID=A0A167REX0_CALVF|nr:hypothetical protein CALVIDRAFT_215043 [Calocera viscosa TUFC12733]